MKAAIEFASLPEHIRGFGHVKLENLNKVRARWLELEAELKHSEVMSLTHRAA